MSERVFVVGRFAVVVARRRVGLIERGHHDKAGLFLDLRDTLGDFFSPLFGELLLQRIDRAAVGVAARDLRAQKVVAELEFVAELVNVFGDARFEFFHLRFEFGELL